MGLVGASYVKLKWVGAVKASLNQPNLTRLLKVYIKVFYSTLWPVRSIHLYGVYNNHMKI